MNTVEISNLTVNFGSFKAVDGISFTVGKGEIFGFLGANGAGKTTTIRVMCGLLQPTAGKISIAGISIEQGLIAVKQKVGYMSQKFTLYDDLSIEENLNFKASLRKIPSNIAEQRARELFKFIDFKYSRATLVKNLPSGVKQQVSLVATLLHNPEIIFLDEPTSGVSPSARALFWGLIRRLSNEGKTIIVTTHYMDEAEECERIALMGSGKLIALDTPEQLKKIAYPDPLLELIMKKKMDAPALKKIFNDNAVITFWPYGLKYHAVMRSGALSETFMSNLPAGIEARPIKPSLEDVFIRLVEGAKR